jgi:hypothetical protein
MRDGHANELQSKPCVIPDDGVFLRTLPFKCLEQLLGVPGRWCRFRKLYPSVSMVEAA